MNKYASKELDPDLRRGDIFVYLELISKLDTLITLHRKHNDMWVDFFETAKEKILKDTAFGCEYLSMAWHGIGGYDNERIFNNDEDEELRRALHPEIYKLAIENKNNDQH